MHVLCTYVLAGLFYVFTPFGFKYNIPLVYVLRIYVNSSVVSTGLVV